MTIDNSPNEDNIFALFPKIKMKPVRVAHELWINKPKPEKHIVIKGVKL